MTLLIVRCIYPESVFRLRGNVINLGAVTK